MAGRTERAIIIETLELNDIEVSQAFVSRFYTALGVAAQELEGRIRESGYSLPGAHEAISALRDRRTVQSLVTGNIRSIAKTKLSAFGLADGLDLEIGGYGDDGSDRADLVRLARERAEVKYQRAEVGAFVRHGRTVSLSEFVGTGNADVRCERCLKFSEPFSNARRANHAAKI